MRPPAIYLRGPHVLENSSNILIPPWVQTPMKYPISYPRTKRVICFIIWSWWWMNLCRGYWGTTSTHECGWGSVLSVSLLLHVDNHNYTTINPGPGFPWSGLPVAICARGDFGDKVDLFILILLAEVCLYMLRLYISSVETMEEKALLIVTIVWLGSPLFASADYFLFLPI